MQEETVTAYLEECRGLVLGEIDRLIPRGTAFGPAFYDLMRDYPFRRAKALRPALCIATCRALGGNLEGVLPSTATLELYHNAFLIHDDVEDGSLKRRELPTLHRRHGVPIAVNVGDGMLALSLEPLLENTRLLGLGKALRILKVVARMARESAEGQAMELDWIRRRRFDLDDADYRRMVHKKTTWYSFITPMLIGGVVAGSSGAQLRTLFRLATAMGSAFQVQDDVLNLVGDPKRYGKEIEGDLWEGKHTLILLHTLRSATAAERNEAEAILAKARPGPPQDRGREMALHGLLSELVETRDLTPQGRELLRATLGVREGDAKTPSEIAFLRRLIDKYDSIPFAQDWAARRTRNARRHLDTVRRWAGPSTHLDVLARLLDFVVERQR